MAWLSIKPDTLVHEAKRLDCLHWLSALKQNREVSSYMSRHTDRMIGADLFNALYQWKPKLRSVDESPDPALTAYIKKLLETGVFNKLRNYCIGDAPLASGAAYRLFKELRENKEPTLEAVSELKNNIDKMESMAPEDSDTNEQYQETMEIMHQAQSNLAKGIEQSDLEGALRELPPDRLYSREESLDSKLDTLAGEVETASKLDELAENTAGGYSPTGEGDSVGMQFLMRNKKVDSQFRRHPKIRKIIQKIGQYEFLINALKSKRPLPQPTPVDIVTGNDISNVLPGEIALLDDPDMEDIFWQKWMDGALLQYKHESRDKLGKGSAIICVDISGSMCSPPIILETAVGLCFAIAKQLVQQHRKAHIILFDTKISFKKDILTPKDLIQAINHCATRVKFGGGTNFEMPMREALAKKEGDKVWADGDIVFISDGDCNLWPDTVKKIRALKTTTKTRMLGINIGGRWRLDTLALLDYSAVAHRRDIAGEDTLEIVEELMDAVV